MARHLLNREDVEYINEHLSARHASDAQTKAVCGCMAPVSVIGGVILQWKFPWTIDYSGMEIPVWIVLGVIGLVISYAGTKFSGVHLNNPTDL